MKLFHKKEEVIMKHNEFNELPVLVQQYLQYIEVVKGHSTQTVNEYASDLRTFFRFLAKNKGLCKINEDDENIDLSPIDIKKKNYFK